MPKAIDLTGHKYGRLTVVSKHKFYSSTGKVQWDCVCDCGASVVAAGNSLRTGNTNSCGCYRLDRLEEVNTHHGHSRMVGASKAYGVWAAMVQRCTNPNNKNYGRYGARGITVCDKWKSFKGFHEDMGDPPEGLTLERKDNDAGYSKENCVWATRKEQSANREKLPVKDIQVLDKFAF